MVEYIVFDTIKLKVKDTFDKINFIQVLNEWFKENEYKDLEGGDDFETVYTHVLRSGGSFLDAWLCWRAVKYPEGTTEKTAYLRYRLNVDMHFLGEANDVEVMHKGKKLKLYKGEVDIAITAAIEMDFRNEWKKKGLLKLLQDIFNKKIYKKQIDYHKEVLYTQSYKLQNMFKQFFNLESTWAREPVSQPPLGKM